MRQLKEIMKNWEVYELNQDNYHIMKEHFLKDKPLFIGSDTETNGLNMLKSTPFDMVFGWITPTTQKVFVWLLNDAPNALIDYKELLKNDCYRHHFAWNAVFDASMLLNIGVDITDRIADGQALLRLISSSDNSFERKALKKVAVKYLCEDADTYEKELKEYLRILKVEWRRKIKAGEDVREPNYTDIPKDLLHKYSPLDVILMMELVKLFYPKVMNKKSNLYQKEIFETECAIIPAVLEQVRTGWKVDLDYLNKSIKNLEKEIKTKREALYSNLGEVINPGQNAELARWFEKQGWEYPIVDVIRRGKPMTVTDYKADKDMLTKIKKAWKDIPEKEKALNVCDLVMQLRTYEKWFSTYLTQIKDNVLEHGDGAFHPYYDAYGAVSGRFTSNAQQFPRGAIYFDDGTELFNPRKLMISGEGHRMYYFDYSQIELRLAAEFTIRAGLPDDILVGAYMNYHNDPNWKPTDMHLEMAINAFELTPEQVEIYLKGEEGAELTPEEKKEHKYVKSHRSLAKIANFASLYGGTRKAINEGLFDGQDIETAIKVEKAFANTFKGVMNYQRWVKDQISIKHEVRNALGRIYWYKSADYNAQKTAANYIIQGTGADYLKGRMAAVWKFIKNNNLKTKFIGNIHDEIQYLIPDDEQWIVPEIKKIMEAETEWSTLPIIVDVEYTDTNWADKKNLH